jgi:hypothetical protein
MGEHGDFGIVTRQNTTIKSFKNPRFEYILEV